MPSVLKCPLCGAGSDRTKDGEWAHCASCNNIFQPKDAEGSKDDEKAKVEAGEGEGKKESEGEGGTEGGK